MWAGSWIGRDLTTWIGEPEENAAWEYLAKTRKDVAASVTAGGGIRAAQAYGEVLAAEGSDWFWWYGSDQTSPNEGAFDEVFRGTLSNVYTMLGEKPPPFLGVPILASAKAAHDAEIARHVAATGAAGGAMAQGEGVAGSSGAASEPAEVEFSHSAPGATSVHLAGDFNGWSTSAEPMSDPEGDGVWTVKVKLAPGSYEYKFVIDGGARWEPDAANPESVPDPYGGKNSVITVD